METVKVIGEVLKDIYGEEVNIRYIDVVDNDLDEYPLVEEYLAKAGMNLPLLVINDRIIRPGIGLNYKEFVEELEQLGIAKK